MLTGPLFGRTDAPFIEIETSFQFYLFLAIGFFQIIDFHPHQLKLKALLHFTGFAKVASFPFPLIF